MDLEQDDWVEEQNDQMDIDGNELTVYTDENIYIERTLTCAQADCPHHFCLFHHRTTGGAWPVQEGTDVLLWPGAEERSQTDSRGGGGAEEAAHRHLRGASLEERCQRQRAHPPVCVRFLPRLFRLKNFRLAPVALGH